MKNDIVTGIKRLKLSDFEVEKSENFDATIERISKKHNVKINEVFATIRAEQFFGWYVFYK